MPLHLMLGRSGSGKTYEMAERVRTLAQERTPIYVLVPDQYTVAAERIYVEHLGEQLMHRVRVTSMKRLSSMMRPRDRVSIRGGGKAVLVRRALDAVSGHLRYYPPNYRNVDFLLRVKDTIRELKANGISPDRLQQVAEIANQPKLYDISLIYAAFETFLQGELADPDDDLVQFAHQIGEQHLLEDTDIYVDFFRNFKAQEYAVLQTLLRNRARVTVALPTDTAIGEGGTELLAEITAAARHLLGFCKKYEIPATMEVLREQKRFCSDELAFLERSFFDEDAFPYAEKPVHLALYHADDLFDEVDAVASRIARMVRDEGYRYRDFAMITRDIDTYAGVLEPVFAQYGIPLFYHKKTPLKQKLLLSMVTALWNITVDGYTQEHVLTFLKAGFSPFSSDEIALFESYIVSWNLSYQRFLQDFRMSVRGYQTTDSRDDVAALETVNRVRRYVVDLVEDWKPRIAGKTVRQISAELVALLESMSVRETLEKTADAYARFGEQALCREQLQVYSLLMSALDEFVSVAGDAVLAESDYREFLTVLIEELDIAIIPTSIDEVLAGSIDAMPLLSPRCVFVLGLQDGGFPKTVTDDALINNTDRVLLEGYEIVFGSTSEKKIRFERYLGYLAFTAPSERLFLSYTSNANGSAVPSMLLTEVRRLFPALSVSTAPQPNDADGIAERLQAEGPSFSLYAELPAEELRDYFMQNPYYAALLDPKDVSTALTAETGRSLFGTELSLSSSKVDTFYSCRYSYFCQYGMRLREDKKFALSADIVGTLTHAVLEHVMQNGLDRSVEEVSADARHVLATYLDMLLRGETPSENFLRHWQVVAKRIVRLLLYLREEMAQSRFVPCGFEIPIRSDSSVKPVEIPIDGGTVHLTGTVDRADVYEKDGTYYLRIIDYKTGSKEFSMLYVENGLNMQMLLYLYSLICNGYPGDRSYVPAGVLYVNANPLIVDVPYHASADMVIKAWEDKRKRSGLFLYNSDVLHAMDREMNGKYIGLKEKGKSRSLATEEEFRQIFSLAGTLLTDMGNALLHGEIKKDSIQLRDADGCTYCPIKPYCNPTHREPVMRNLICEKNLGDKKGKE